MIIYSKKIVQFIQEIKLLAKEILSKEIGVKVGRDRFYNRDLSASYPIHIVIYDNKELLGYFDPSFYELGFHEMLMLSTKEQLGNVIRHELAHYMTFILYGETRTPHGESFRSFCQSMGWGQEVYRASAKQESCSSAAMQEESAVLRRVQKLMALSSSANYHEAEQAMIKSQQLLLKYNIDSACREGEQEEKIFLKRILQQKKENAKMRSIAKILETFFVNTVYRKAKDSICLEILGTAVNVEIAEYVADILQHELENQWERVRKQANLKGMMAKNSFFVGVAKGYCNKMQSLKNEYTHDETRALMVIEKKLTEAVAMAYQRLSYSKRGGGRCSRSSALGEQAGRQLQIHPALRKADKTARLSISYAQK